MSLNFPNVIHAAGSVLGGSGALWSSACRVSLGESQGKYLVSLDVPAPSDQTVIVVTMRGMSGIARTSHFSASQKLIETFTTDGETTEAADRDFDFTIIRAPDGLAESPAAPTGPVPFPETCDPSIGSEVGGTAITITGQNFSEVTQVYCGEGQPVASFEIVDDNTITAVTSAGVGETQISMDAEDGIVGAVGEAFFVYAFPVITEVTPGFAGPNGEINPGYESIGITGQDLINILTGDEPEITFDGDSGLDIGYSSASFVFCTPPPKPDGVDFNVPTDLVVTDTWGSSLPFPFTYVPHCVPDHCEPDTGAPEDIITLVGAGLEGVTSVRFNDIECSFSVLDDNDILVTVPDGFDPGDSVDVTVENPVFVETLTAAFTYQSANAPNVISADPAFASSDGGNTITITGERFTGVDPLDPSAVVIDGNSADEVVVVDDNTITCRVPSCSDPNNAGFPVTVSVTSPDGTGHGDVYTYYSVPNPTEVSPRDTPYLWAGGENCLIQGTGLFGTNSVVIGGVAMSIASIDGSGVHIITQAGFSGSPADGVVDVVCSNPLTDGTGTGIFKFMPVPDPEFLDPSSTDAGATTTVHGANFEGVSDIQFGGVSASNIVPNPPTFETVDCTVPSGTPGATVDVTVCNPSTSTNLANGFTYAQPFPQVDSIDPSDGTFDTSHNVTIHGSGFTGANSVFFAGGFFADNVNVVDDNTVTCDTPVFDSALGFVDVSVSNGTNIGTGFGIYNVTDP